MQSSVPVCISALTSPLICSEVDCLIDLILSIKADVQQKAEERGREKEREGGRERIVAFERSY